MLSPSLGPRALVPFLFGLSVLAWLALVLWGQSPYARYLDHQQLDTRGEGTLLPIFVLGWLLMIVAMMLPTSVPLIRLFAMMTRLRADHHWLVLLLLLGYVGVWGIFGVSVHALDAGLHALVDHNDYLAEHAWLIGPAVLGMAGIYQFTPLKYHCLDRCRSPLAFVTERWRGRRPRAAAFNLGVSHGVYCLGCCWSLMLLLFAVGTGSVGWMLGLGALMAVEKNMRFGRRLSAPVGVVLVGCAVVSVVLAATA